MKKKNTIKSKIKHPHTYFISIVVHEDLNFLQESSLVRIENIHNER